jgi:hypothetical protein
MFAAANTVKLLSLYRRTFYWRLKPIVSVALCAMSAKTEADSAV